MLLNPNMPGECCISLSQRAAIPCVCLLYMILLLLYLVVLPVEPIFVKEGVLGHLCFTATSCNLSPSSSSRTDRPDLTESLIGVSQDTTEVSALPASHQSVRQ